MINLLFEIILLRSIIIAPQHYVNNWFTLKKDYYSAVPI